MRTNVYNISKKNDLIKDKYAWACSNCGSINTFDGIEKDVECEVCSEMYVANYVKKDNKKINQSTKC